MSEECEIVQEDRHSWVCLTHGDNFYQGTQEPVFCPTGWENVK